MALGKSVREIESWPAYEIQEWFAYYELEPFGQERENYHSAQIAAVVAQVNGNKTTVADFMYRPAADVAAEQIQAFFGRMDKLKEAGKLN